MLKYVCFLFPPKKKEKKKKKYKKMICNTTFKYGNSYFFGNIQLRVEMSTEQTTLVINCTKIKNITQINNKYLFKSTKY